MGGRAAKRAAAVGADGDRADARRHGRRAAAGRAAGRAVEGMGIARRPEQSVVGISLHCEFGRVCLAEEDGARSPQPRHRRFVLPRHKIAIGGATPSRGHSRDMEIVLDRERDAIERRERRTAEPTRGRLRRGGLRAGPIQSDDRIDRRIELIESRVNSGKGDVRREQTITKSSLELRGRHRPQRSVANLVLVPAHGSGAGASR